MLLYRRLRLSTLYTFMFCTSVFATPKPDLYILIHGSFASPTHMMIYGNRLHWCQPGHKSFEMLKITSGATLINHPWSGGINLSDLVAGAQTLIVLIKKYLPTHTIHIVAHSNGGNVALLAIDALARNSHAKIIDQLILLGTPIYLHWYPTSIKAVRSIYNLFSYGDVIQPVFNHYERLLPEHNHIFNIQVTMNGACATHNHLYKADIIRLIPQFRHLFAKKDKYCLHCATGKDPIIVLDVTRDADILNDKNNIKKLFTGNQRDWLKQLKDQGAAYRKTISSFISDIRSAIEDIN